ncbi:neural-cadherin-like isoform X4 [Eriocheir sinensis]|uniref:neural-cadherin-like isoform X4 n=1 Tax=Eriocheir sinensis TaxID=95602 RepID=UPI0021C7D1B2|nr:neural-cadherin-like isoform X4 [Eriocheir sinensis]
MDPAKLLQIITNSTWMVTQLAGVEMEGGGVELGRRQYLREVREDQEPGVLLTVTARVLQEGPSVTFRVVEGGEEGLFSLHPSSGRLSLLKNLDYESKQQHELVVEAAAGRHRSRAGVALLVRDVNEYPPVFPRGLHQTQITEEDDSGLPKTILTVRAKDEDAGEWGRVRYTLSGDGVTSPSSSPSSPSSSSSSTSSSPSFSIHPTSGDIYLLKPLDRDPPHGRPQWRLRVVATDGELSAATHVHVNLKDVNDNAPYFPTPRLAVAVPEDAPRGASVAQVLARDNDDPREGGHARLTYSLLKNVVDEASGRQLFAVDGRTGLVTTALCCLDRERAARYTLTAAATDGGGLKATGTVLVEVTDVNDTPPRFARRSWQLHVRENQARDAALAGLPVTDRDARTTLAFAVVPESGRGWQLFSVEAGGGEGGGGHEGGVLKSLVPLDYENPDHRGEFRFKVQVTDKGVQGWQQQGRQGEAQGHVDEAWVSVWVTDANDNTPTLSHAHAHRTLPEDTPVGTHLAAFPAHDADKGGRSRISYAVAPESNPRGIFSVDGAGAVLLAGALDRETQAAHTVLVWAVDDGEPPRTATATLTLNVTDVNDNAPFLREPREVTVQENAGPREVARVRLGDRDSWREGHGPPFTLALDPRAPPHVAAVIQVTLDPGGDEGRGVGVVGTRASLDREAGRVVLVPLVVGDAGRPLPRTATVTLTLHVGDENDNPMTPAAKTVAAHVLAAPGSPPPQPPVVPLGRVYVRDPDDWDAASKRYAWRGPRHPAFTLDPATGHLTMGAATQEGRYELAFSVSDEAQGQVGVEANVTVEVRAVSASAAEGATPLTLEAPPRQVVREQGGESVLSRLVEAAGVWVTGGGAGVVAVCVEPLGSEPHQHTRVWLAAGSSTPSSTSTHSTSSSPSSSSSCASSSSSSSSSLPGRCLQDLLLLHRDKLSEAAGVSVTEVGAGACPEGAATGCAGGCVLRAGLSEHFVLVDANTSSIVGPQLSLRPACSCEGKEKEEEAQGCVEGSCLNGGRCVRTSQGARCVCPHHTHGSRCKMLARHFDGGGAGDGGQAWVWVPPVPPCPDVHLSLEFLTRSPDATLLYAGPHSHPPTHSTHSHSPPTLHNTTQSPPTARDVLALELRAGRPWVLLDLGGGPVSLSLNTSALADNTWHRLDLLWARQVVLLLVDLCSGGSLDTTPTPTTTPTTTTSTPNAASLLQNLTASTTSPPPTPTPCRAWARLPEGGRYLDTPGPLQVGGWAHPPPPHAEYGWPRPLVERPFTGCIRNLRLNGELVDLGRGLLGRRSAPGCPAADCAAQGLTCGPHARCVGSPGSLQCECEAGWAGDGCSAPTRPTDFLPHSYIRLALSFTPLAHATSLQLRFRTRQQDGQLAVLSSQRGHDRLALQLVHGRLCLLLHTHPRRRPRPLCLARARLTDGRWHVVRAARHGSSTLLSADEGDGELYNASIPLGDAEAANTSTAATLLQVDGQVGLHIGGSPEYAGVSVIKIHGDYHDGCVDDVRVSGRVLPLPPAHNNTQWGQTSMFQGVQDGCGAPPACTNVTCSPPLTCVDTWRAYHCGCGAGQVLSGTRASCVDEDECAWDPCLHGGTCINEPAGFLCRCASGFSGRHCHLSGPTDASLRISLTATVATVAWSVLLLLCVAVVVCALLLHQHHRRAALRRGGSGRVNSDHQRTTSSPLGRSHTQGANGQPAWTTRTGGEPDVLELQVNHQHSEVYHPASIGETELTGEKANKRRKGSVNGINDGGEKRRGGGCDVAAGDDLRNYSYEGEGSSPGSLSSCLESCGGSAKFLGGFREVARALENWEAPSGRSTHSTPTKADPSPSTTTLCHHHYHQHQCPPSPILSYLTPCPPSPSAPSLTQPTTTLPPPILPSDGVRGYPAPES